MGSESVFAERALGRDGPRVDAARRRRMSRRDVIGAFGGEGGNGSMRDAALRFSLGRALTLTGQLHAAEMDLEFSPRRNLERV
jgi:hypothetical protein